MVGCIPGAGAGHIVKPANRVGRSMGGRRPACRDNPKTTETQPAMIADSMPPTFAQPRSLHRHEARRARQFPLRNNREFRAIRRPISRTPTIPRHFDSEFGPMPGQYGEAPEWRKLCNSAPRWCVIGEKSLRRAFLVQAYARDSHQCHRRLHYALSLLVGSCHASP